MLDRMEAVAEAELSRGDAALEDCQYEEALKVYRALEDGPLRGCSTVLARMGRCYLALGDVTRALHVSTTLLRADACDVEGHLLRAEAQFEAIDDHIDSPVWATTAAAAISSVRQAVAFDPEHRRAGQLYRRLRSHVDMIRQVQDALGVGRLEQARACLSCVLDAMRPQDSGSARSSGDNAGRKPPSARFAARCYAERGKVRLGMDDYEGSLSDCSVALSLDGRLPVAWVTKAQALQKQERWEEAADALEKLYSWHKTDDIFWKMEWAKFEVRRSQRPDYYAILGVDSSSIPSQIKRSYLRLSAENHPDKLMHKSPHMDPSNAEDKFKMIAEAYEFLSDPAKRELYDRGYDAQGIREVLAVRKRFAGQAPCSKCGEDESGKFGPDGKWYCSRCLDAQHREQPQHAASQPPGERSTAVHFEATGGGRDVIRVPSALRSGQFSFSLSGSALGWRWHGYSASSLQRSNGNTANGYDKAMAQANAHGENSGMADASTTDVESVVENLVEAQSVGVASDKSGSVQAVGKAAEDDGIPETWEYVD